MITNDMISQVTGIVRRVNLDKMRACYIEYSTDFDGRAECRDYETKIKNAQKKIKDLAWTNEVYALRDTKLSAAAAKYYTCKSILDEMIKAADAIVAADLAARKAKAQAIDAEYDKYAGVLSNERIADARIFVKSYYSMPANVLMFCQKATGAEIKKFEARLDKNFKDNGYKAQAAELDKKFATLTPIKREKTYFTMADTVIAQIMKTSADIRVFCAVATGIAVNKLSSEINTEKKYLECEEQINKLASSKEQTVAWCERVWSEYKSLSPNIDKYRNAQILRNLNDDANKMYADFKAKAKAIDTDYEKYSGTLTNDQITKARAFVKNYYATAQFITALCQKATGAEIKKFEIRLDKNLKDNGLRAQAAELDKKFATLNPVKRDRTYFAAVDAIVSQINMASADVRVYCTVATGLAITKLKISVDTEKKFLECEEQIDRLALAKTRSVSWCQRAWSEYNALLPNISHYRNEQKLRGLNNEATAIYTEITCEPYVKALDGRSSFKTVLELDEGLKTFKEKDVLNRGIASFEDKWKKRVKDAWGDAHKQAAEYYKQGKANYDQKQYAKAWALFKDAEKYGNTDAYYMLGEHYYYGYAIGENRNKAIEYYNKAAELGNINAMNDLGVIYETSQPEVSFKWRKKSVDLGGSYSRLPLAKMYYDGRGTKRSFADARALFEKLAKEGNAEANAYLGQMYEKGIYVATNEKLALEYYKKGLSIDWAKKAHDSLSRKLEEERRDKEIEDQLALAKQGYPEAQRFIGECYYKGYRTTKSYEMAREWFERAAKQGNGRAMTLLGDMYMNGEGVKQDLKKAKKYYQDAIKHGEK